MADTSKQIKDLVEATSVNDDDLFLVQANDDNCRKVTKETLLREINADKTTILNTIGTENMGTTSTTLKGAIKEINTNISSSNSTNIETYEATKQLTGVKDGFVDNLVVKGRTRYKKNDGSYTDIWESGIMVKSVGEDDNNQVKLKAYNSDKTISDNVKIEIKEPLRSLPNGVRDIIDYEKGILTRNIGKIVLNGSESWDFESTFNQGGVRRGYVLLSTLSQIKPGDGALKGDLICDKFTNETASFLYNNPVEGIGKSATAMAIHIMGSKLQSQDVAGFKAWLQSNNVTVYYQLATPIIEQIDNTKTLKTFKDGYLSLENIITPIVNLNYSVNISSVLNSHAEIIGKHSDNIGNITSQLNENANAIEILNKKDLRTNIHLTDATIFSPTLTSSHECWNKWVSVEGNNMEYAPHPGALWGEVFTGGTDTRAFQIFISVFDSARKIYVRYKHDSKWSEFRYFGTGYIKELELKNGWVKFDLTPTYSLTGNTLSVNARIKSGVTSANTLIAETGFYASGGQSSFYNCYTPTGQQLGTIAFTNDGRILIVNEFSSNADVCFNFSVCVN